MKRNRMVLAAAVALLVGFGTVESGRATAAPTTMPAAAGKATLTIKVVDDKGHGVPDAKVDLMEAPAGRRGKKAAAADADKPMPDGAKEGKGKADALQSASTDGDGSATLRDVPNGSYLVRARVKKVGNGRERVTVSDDKDATVTITLKAKA